MMGFTKDKFDSAQMTKMLRRFMGEVPLSSAFKPCLIPAYDISQQAAYHFDSLLATQEQYSNFPIWQVAQATASAPVYFEPMVVQAQDGSRRTLIDGGIFRRRAEAFITATRSFDNDASMYCGLHFRKVEF
ncbi:MAG: patatin-like phospholipase family protein [Bacteroidota bacterium]